MGKKKIVRTVITDDNTQTPEQEIEESLKDAPADFASQFRDYCVKNKLEDSGWNVALYRYAPGSNRKTKRQVNSWADHIPEAHDVGLEYGSGDYVIYASSRNGNGTVKTFSFSLDESYDEMRARSRPPAAAAVPQSLNTGVEMIGSVISNIVKPLIEARGAPVPSQTPEMFGGMVAMMQTAMQNMMSSQMEFMRKMQKDMMENRQPTIPEGEYEEMEDQESGAEKLIKMFMPLVDKFAPIILGRQPGAETVISILKESPQYKALLKNQEQLSVVLRGLKSKLGPADYAKFLQEIGLTVPADSKPTKPAPLPKPGKAA